MLKTQLAHQNFMIPEEVIFKSERETKWLQKVLLLLEHDIF